MDVIILLVLALTIFNTVMILYINASVSRIERRTPEAVNTYNTKGETR